MNATLPPRLVGAIRARLTLLTLTRFMAILVAGVGGIALLAGTGLRVNTTPSLPLGLYVVTDGAPVRLRRGDLVLACAPPPAARLARTRGYLPPSRWQCPEQVTAVGKFVVALPGDTVRVAPSGLAVNGRAVPRSARLRLDGRGRPLPHPTDGVQVVQPGEVWLVSPLNPYSFDSRYYAAVRTSAVRATVRPLWTARQRTPRATVASANTERLPRVRP